MSTAARGITRREGLVALALLAPAALVTACTDSGPAPDPVPTTSAPVEDLAGAAATREAGLVARYEAALAALPGADGGLRELLAAIRDQHRSHLDALGGAADPSTAPPQPAAAAAVVAELIAAERQAAADAVADCVAAGEAELARVLAMIAASEASHVPALRRERS